MTDGSAHADRVPPGTVDLNRRIGKIARHHELRVDHRRIGMTHTTRSRGIYQQDGPLRSAGTRGKRLVAFDEVTTVNTFDSRPKANRLPWLAGLRLAAPRHPFFTALNDPFEPARLLFLGAHTVEQYERIDVAFPTTR